MRRWRPVAIHVAALVALYLCVAFLLTFAARQNGWYPNHETWSGFERVESWRRAFAAGDWAPVWTPFCNNGHGCPTPLLYHRLFNAFAGLLAVFLGTATGLKLAVPLVLAAGALGMHRAVRAIGAPLGMCIAGALLFVTGPYVLTDWLARNAFAEFTAIALVPWVLAGVVRLSRGEDAGLGLGVSTALLFHAHSVMCLYLLPVLPIAGLVAIGTSRRPGAPAFAAVARWSARTLLRFAAPFLLLTGPVLLATAALRNALNLDYLSIFHPARGYVPMARYALDPYDWSDPYGYSVEVGRWLLVLLVASGFGAWILRARRDPAVVTLLLGGAFYVWLLHPSSSGFYYQVPGAALLQFPWRLVVMLLPIAALLASAFSAAILRIQPGAANAVAVMVGGVILLQAVTALDDQKVTHKLTSRELNEKIQALDGPNNPEYLPKGVTAGARTPFVALQGCVARGGPLPEAVHLGAIDLDVDVPTDCKVEFSQFCSPLLEVSASRGTPGCSPAGLLVVDIPPGPPARVTLKRRGLWAMILGQLRK